MSASTDGDDPRNPTSRAIISCFYADLTTPGVVVELDAEEAESLGAFAETALTEEAAWDANADLEPDDGDPEAGEPSDGA